MELKFRLSYQNMGVLDLGLPKYGYTVINKGFLNMVT